MHKAFDEDFKNWNAEVLENWVTEEATHEKLVLFQTKYDEEGAAHMNARNLRSWIFKFIKENNLRETAMVKLGNLYNADVRYLPTSWFECDPCELIFERVNPKYRDLKAEHPGWTWRERGWTRRMGT